MWSESVNSSRLMRGVKCSTIHSLTRQNTHTQSSLAIFQKQMNYQLIHWIYYYYIFIYKKRE